MVKTPKATSQSAYQNPTSCEQKNANTKCDFFYWHQVFGKYKMLY